MRQVLIPSWYRANHPLHLSSAVRRIIRKEFNSKAIFLNIPYSARYTDLEIAVLSTATAYGLTPRMAKEEIGLSVRLHKIARMILSCGYGFTDLTYVKRMNLPFELGLLLAWGKDTFVVSAKPYQSLRTISDLNFGDVYYHQRSVGRLIKGFSRWLRQHYPAKEFGLDVLLERYRRWQRIRKTIGRDFDNLTPEQIGKMIEIAKEEFKLRFPTTNRRRRRTNT